MTSSGPRPRVANAFLRRYLEDRNAGLERSLAEYQAIWPGHEDLVAAEYARLVALEQEETGRRVGPYRLLREVGRGGQGIVHLAEDTRLGRRVALKLFAGLTLDHNALKRFRREAAMAARVDHPGICTVYEADEAGEVLYIAMQHIAGRALKDLLETARRGSVARDSIPGTGLEPIHEITTNLGRPQKDAVRRVVALVAAVCEALEAAHARGVVHRDIKPGNVMITPDGRPVVLDFGLAAGVEGDLAGPTRSGLAFGTPAYMAPEQVRGAHEEVGKRTDIWAAGVVLYELLALRRPFEGSSRAALEEQILETPAPDVRRANPAVSRDLAMVVGTALEKDPGRRYAEMGDLRRDLEAVLAHRPVTARPPGPLVALQRAAQRHRRLTATTAASVVLLALAAVFLAMRSAEEAARERRGAREQARQRVAAARGLLDSLRDEIQGDVPEQAYPGLIRGLSQLSGDGPGLAKGLQAARVLAGRGRFVEAEELARRVLARAPPPAVRLDAESLVGRTALYRLDLPLARSHWRRVAQRAGPASRRGRTARAGLELVEMLDGMRIVKKSVPPRAASYSTCLLPAESDDEDLLVILKDEQHGTERILHVLRRDPQGGVEMVPVAPQGRSWGGRRPMGIWRSGLAGRGRRLFLVLGRRGKVKRVLQEWRLFTGEQGVRAEPVQELAVLEEPVVHLLACDLTGDGRKEVAVGYGPVSRKLSLLLPERDGDWRRRDLTPFSDATGRTHHDEDITALLRGPPRPDGGRELLVATGGHHFFGLFRVCLEQGGPPRIRYTPLGALGGLVAAPAPHGRNLLALRSFVPWRDDLLLRLDPDILGGPVGVSGLEVGPGGASLGPCLWTWPRGMGSVVLRRPVMIQQPGSLWLAFTGAHWAWPAGKTSWDQHIALVRSSGSSPPPLPGFLVDADFGQVWGAGDCDGDGKQELVLCGASGVALAGLEEGGSADPAGFQSNGGPYRLGEAWAASRQLLSVADVLGGARRRPEPELARATGDLVRALMRAKRYSALDAVVGHWLRDVEAPWRQLLRGDMALLVGRYEDAAAAYEAVAGAEGGLFPDLGSEVRRRIAATRVQTGTVRLQEEFEDRDPGAWSLQASDRSSVRAARDPFGHRGAREGHGAFAILRRARTASSRDRPSTPCIMASSPVWDGCSPFRLRLLVHLARLDYSTSFLLSLSPQGGTRAPSFLVCLSHVRNGRMGQGDVHRLTFRMRDRSKQPMEQTGEFPVGRWLGVTLSYEPRLRRALLLLRRADLGPDATPVARLLMRIRRPVGQPAPHHIELNLHCPSVDPLTPATPRCAEALLDAVTFETWPR